jgi:hypothetical protein
MEDRLTSVLSQYRKRTPGARFCILDSDTHVKLLDYAAKCYTGRDSRLNVTGLLVSPS